MRTPLLASLLLTACLASSTAMAQGDDVGSAHEAICCGSECCLIGGTCYRRGDTNPANSCQMCDPGTDQRSFTAVTGCGGTDAGPGTTDSGGCTVSARSSAAPLVILGVVGVALVWVRRRRDRRR